MAAAADPPAVVPPLFEALLLNRPDRVLELLAIKPAAALQKLPGGFTTLHAAALGGCEAAVWPLLAAGVGLESRLQGMPSRALGQPAPQWRLSRTLRRLERLGVFHEIGMCRTPLHVACVALQPEVLEALLEAGADGREPTAADFHTAIELVDRRRYGQAEDCIAQRVRRLLLEKGGSEAMNSILAWPDRTPCPASRAAIRLYLSHAWQRHDSGRCSLDNGALLECLRAACRAGLPGWARCFAGCFDAVAAAMVEEQLRQGLLMAAVVGGCAEALAVLRDSGLVLGTHGAPHMLNHVLSRAEDAPLMALHLVQLGFAPSLFDINVAISNACAAETLAALVSAPQRPPPVPPGTQVAPVVLSSHDVLCPFYSLLRLVGAAGVSTRWHARVAEVLLSAGLRPATYDWAVSRRRWDAAARDYRPVVSQQHCAAAELAARACRHGAKRALWLMISGAGWSPVEHRHWPPAFKAAARTLLLAQRRSDNPLGALPAHVVLRAIAAAALPLSAWLPAEE